MKLNQILFLDVRVFNLNASKYANQSFAQCYVKNENEKKRNYNERILTVDNGNFTPPVFSLYGGMGREYRKCYKRVSNMLAEKRDTPQHITWVNAKTFR